MQKLSLLLFLIIFLSAQAFYTPTPEAPLQDSEGTPIYLTPQAETAAPSPTPGPEPTPMKIARRLEVNRCDYYKTN